MKKILSLTLAALMVVSAVPMVYATTDYENGTQVTYNAEDPDGDGNLNNQEAYTVTVPALMAPGDTAQVSVAGTWNSSRKLVVTADENVVLKNSINEADTKTLAVTFDGFDLAGSNTAAMSGEKDITVAEMPADALFGTWSGVITYEAGIVDVQ